MLVLASSYRHVGVGQYLPRCWPGPVVTAMLAIASLAVTSFLQLPPLGPLHSGRWRQVDAAAGAITCLADATFLRRPLQSPLPERTFNATRVATRASFSFLRSVSCTARQVAAARMPRSGAITCLADATFLRRPLQAVNACLFRAHFYATLRRTVPSPSMRPQRQTSV
jgi:hypothetical protein